VEVVLQLCGRVAFGGDPLASENEDDACKVVVLSAALAPVDASISDESKAFKRGREACEDALAAQLPPGALRASLRVLWSDDDLCVLRFDADDATIVLKRLAPAEPVDDDSANAQAAHDAGAVLGEEEEEAEPFWVGSPY
jgi:hypothetical protein